jgi:Tfp pilus assembly protein PilO
MKRLPPAKRNQLILVIFVTVALIGTVYLFLISPQNNEIRKLDAGTSGKRAELQKIKDTIKQKDATGKKLDEISRQLNLAEEDIATGDISAWTYDTLRRFKSSYHVDIPSIGQGVLSDVDLLADFPYRQVKLSLNGTAYYHDLGKFVSDFENNFPHMRLLNLSIEPANNAAGEATERLNFHMDVVTLVKPNP